MKLDIVRTNVPEQKRRTIAMGLRLRPSEAESVQAIARENNATTTEIMRTALKMVGVAIEG